MRSSDREDAASAPGSEDFGVEALLFGALLYSFVHVVCGIVGHVEGGGLRVVIFVGLRADVLLVHAESVEGIADALHRGLVLNVRDPQHRLPWHDVSSSRREVEV
jgi:hypothetical protein